jgi:hypothetical protein
MRRFCDVHFDCFNISFILFYEVQFFLQISFRKFGQRNVREMKMKIWSELIYFVKLHVGIGNVTFFLFSHETQGVQKDGRYTVAMVQVRFYR